MARRFRSPALGSFVALVLLAGSNSYAQNAGARVDTAKQPAASSTAQRTTTPARGAARGPLPDPLLLDGSALPVEKKNEQGMIGDFELPGDDNAPRNAKVGGQQSPPGAGQAGRQGGGPQQMGLPQMGGSGSSQSAQQSPAPQGGAQPAGAEQNTQAAGASDPNAKAEGMQVGQLQTDPNAGNDGQPMPEKPAPVKIGDSAMQIKGIPNAAAAVGTAVPASQTQQVEKPMGGGRGSNPIPGGRNASEKGRTMPAGL